MTAGEYDFIIEKGARWNPTLTWKDSTGSAIDLTGYSAKMEIRSSQAASSTIFSLTSGSEITLGGAAGTIAIDVGAASTSAVVDDTGVYDLELTDGSSNVTRLIEGKVTFKDEVTR